MPLSVKKRILIVDDDPNIHKLITKGLTENQYDITCAFDAATALDQVMRERPDLVILDLMMPHMSGIEVCRALKSNPKTKDIYVLILSAKEGQSDRISGLELGADDYVSKPFHVAVLTRKIEYILSKTPQPSPSP